MTKLFYLFLGLLLSQSCLAQDDYKEASKESQAYRTIRERNTTPPYSLDKIEALIAKIKSNDNDDNSSTEALSPKIYATLSLREKFTYHMIHGETYSQNCDIIPPIQDEQKKVFGFLLDPFGEYKWGDRQTKFFKDNKDSVIALLTESIQRSKHIGLNYKQVIADINATSMIPLLIATYNEKKNDRDILTVLMLLMRNNKYPPFLSSLSYRKLYTDEQSNHRDYLDFNPANEQLILQRATEFYNGLLK